MRLMLDTSIALDFMLAREPHFSVTRKLMLLGYLREVELWISAAQINDLLYVLTRGGKQAYKKEALEGMKKLLKCVRVAQVGQKEAESILNSTWADLEDAYLHQSALSLKADYIITRNANDFDLSSIEVLDTQQFFEFLKLHKSITYHEFELDTV